MSRPKRPCLDCGILTRNASGRCDPHQAARNRARNQKRQQQPQRRAYDDTDYRAARRHARAGNYGPCVDCGRWDDLTLDHVIPLILGGRNHPSNWVVRCRPCNSSKGATCPS